MINIRLDRDIESRARTRPIFNTEMITTDGGFEVRNSRWSSPKHSFEFNFAPGDRTDMGDLADFIDLFYAAGGMAETFLFTHYHDYIGTNENCGTGDGATQTFQLYRNYTRGLITRQRKITRPRTGTVVVYKDGVEAVSGWTVDTATGIITFSVAPANGVVVTADFEFDVLVRFDNDDLELVSYTKTLEQPMSIELLEVRE